MTISEENLLLARQRELSEIINNFDSDEQFEKIDKLISRGKADGYNTLSNAEVERIIEFNSMMAEWKVLNSQILETQKIRDLNYLLVAQEQANMAQAAFEENLAQPLVLKKVVFNEQS
jgi:hypothetical protein